MADGLTWIFVTPPETPEEITEVYATAFADVMADPEFLEAANDVLGREPEPVLQDEAVRIRGLVDEITPEVKEAMQDYMNALTR